MRILKILSFSLAGIAFFLSAFLAYRIYFAQKEIDTLHQTYADINKIDYGLFNMQEWKIKAFDVFSGHIEQFNISPTAYKEAEAELRKYLYTIYDKYIESGDIFKKVFEDAEKSNKVNKMILKLFKDNIQTQVQALDIKSHIPQMAKQLAAELKNNEPKFRELMQKELVNLMQYKDKYSFIDPRTPIFNQMQCVDLECTNAKIKEKVGLLEADQRSSVYLVMGLILVSLLLIIIGHSAVGMRWTVSLVSLFSIVLLALGISMPMIIIDARMNSFVFNLFEKDLEFGEQVVFYQSKSILDVTRNLIESRGLDLKVVGIMILCFSVIFPLIKLILSALFVQYAMLRESKFAKNMIFYLGKWSMADVFVVALFMAYIGFYGLIGSQLEGMERNKGGFAIETVNYTHLSTGALFFTTYCILSIVLGIVVNKWHQSTNSRE